MGIGGVQEADIPEWVEDHRRDVIRRLMAAGVTRRGLLAVLPGWADLIHEVGTDLRG
jgi:hypothetical protein